MKRETFVSILSACLAEATPELLSEARNLLGWAEREQRTRLVREYAPGQKIVYLLKDGLTRHVGTVDHLNKFSLSLREAHATEGYTAVVVPIERVLGPWIDELFV